MKTYKEYPPKKSHKDGKQHCARIKEDPGFAVVVWREHKESGEIIWDGWFYADEVIHSLYPDGVNVVAILEETHEAEVNQAHEQSELMQHQLDAARYAQEMQKDAERRTRRPPDWEYKGKPLREWAQRLPFTIEQLTPMVKHGVSLENPKFVVLKTARVPERVELGPAGAPARTMSTVDDTYCPVIYENYSRDTATVVMPDGQYRDVEARMVQ